MRVPLGNRVIVEPDVEKEKTVGGIIIPRTANMVTRSGVIVAVSSSCKDIKKGDRVNFHKNSGTKVSPDEEALIMADAELWWIDK